MGFAGRTAGADALTAGRQPPPGSGRRPWLTLIAAIVDATGDVPFAVFREQAVAHGYLLLLREVVRYRGVPLALYSDRHGIFSAKPSARSRSERR